MKWFIWPFAAMLYLPDATSAGLELTRLTPSGHLIATNTFTNGVLLIEKASALTGPWMPELSVYSTSAGTELDVVPDGKPGLTMLRGRALDLSGDQPPYEFAPGDILDLAGLAGRLTGMSGGDAVSQFLTDSFSNSTLDLLFTYLEGEDPALRSALISEFNVVLERGGLYDVTRFESVALTPKTRSLVDQNPSGTELMHLNRLLLEDVYPRELLSKRAAGLTNFVASYGRLTTLAGSGQIVCNACDSWDPAFEGGAAIEASLSSPHIAMADQAGNVYIADKRANAIRKVTPDGRIVTVAGNGFLGHGDTNPAPAVTIPLNNPNGLWVLPDGRFYVLDRDNGYIRRVDTNGIMTVVVDNVGPIPGGRGLWVSLDESVLYFAANSEVKRWDSTNGLAVYANGFLQTGNLAIDPGGHVVVTDSDANRVFRIESDGSKTVIAGNGEGSGGGGDGALATNVALSQVRAIWYLPNGAFLLGTDYGSQVWYVDTDSHIHLLVHGDPGGAHAGDGNWFYEEPTVPKVSFVKQITVDYSGNLLITESSAGYVRKIPFLPP